MDWQRIDHLIDLALDEDLPAGDITTEAIIPEEELARAVFQAKQVGVLAGIEVAARVFNRLDPEVEFIKRLEDGQEFQPGQVLAEVSGRAASLLKGERTALNFLQRLSGVASLTRLFVEATRGTRARILDTRKTTPGWRQLEKYAVRMGGGTNHRMSLSDMMLIKDNHLRQAGGIAPALKKAREYLRARSLSEVKIEVEATSLDEVREALDNGADWIMLDNMTVEEIRAAVELVSGRVPLEASGRVNLQNVRELALAGVDYISVGALTHSFKSADISLEFL
ncbi:MAG: Quinolinate phosphoribosyltransferase [decarboxylating] [Candidatus Saccharicenans subterraneus]|uniref:Probable nicotinate-nucleotide pyrophosphorylase [carboxylating] n=1 Tax=Candidatus Saccharicenans subterraneus TaxID=2508984 RepID=A0A3E2BL81_9BACT|nr:MAG: Quinolinate phosphoribosyltransferase [decarboxylating] [Candidatus Saccharicenans subterraneum]